MIYYGVVEDRISDPLKLGRCKVRIVGLHTENNRELPTAELPWAMIMQPTTSSANSGIGYSPTGIVEGTWVMVVFRDEFNQSPIIIGTLAGIPTKEEPIKINAETRAPEDTTIRSGDGSAVTDGSGRPITSGEQEIEKVEKPAPEPSNAFKRPSAMKIDQAGLDFIAFEEGLASTTPAPKNTLASKKASASTPLYPYLDTKNIWTIGWGATYLADGSPVTAESRITKQQADYLKKVMLSGELKIPGFVAFEPYLRKNIKAPLTQSMYNACISMMYNMGPVGFVGSQVGSAINAGKYEEAASLIPVTKSKGLEIRRRREQALFLKDGIPQDDGTVKQIPSETIETPDATNNPVVRKTDKFSATGSDATVSQLAEPGFVDPNKQFPRLFNEPDTHRLARHERVDGTIVFKKEVARVKGIATAAGNSWSQPPIPYNAKYPYNRIYASESGHLQEFDDTPGNERVHTYHKSGTYTEIDVNGTQVNRIVGDSFQIIERNGNILIKGNCNITIEGNGNIKVGGNANIQAGAGINLSAGGDVGISAGGNISLKAGGSIGGGAGGDVVWNAGGSFSGTSGGDAALDGAAVHLNSGKGKTASSPPGLGNVGGSEFPVLSTPNRFAEASANYETDDEGNPSDAFNQSNIDNGTVDPDEVDTSESLGSTDAKKTPGQDTKISDSDVPEQEFTKAYRLSTNFTLGSVLGANPVPTGSNARAVVLNMKAMAVNVLEPVKKRFPNMTITSSYRSPEKNAGTPGASSTSKHMTGEAIDFVLSGFNRSQMYEAASTVKDIIPAFDKVCLEYSGSKTWIHVQYMRSGNRNQCFTLQVQNDKTGKPRTVTIQQFGFKLISG